MVDAPNLIVYESCSLPFHGACAIAPVVCSLKHENEVRLPAADGPFMAVGGMPEPARFTPILRVEAPPHAAWLMPNIIAIEVVCAR
jgi:hypothetical protein